MTDAKVVPAKVKLTDEQVSDISERLHKEVCHCPCCVLKVLRLAGVAE